MQYISGFFDYLGNTYTPILVAFLTGFAIGVIRIGHPKPAIALLLGLLFAVLAAVLVALIEYILPGQVNISLGLKTIFTLLLLLLFFIIVATSMSNSKLIN
jgi:hypothetical protein